MSQKKDKANRRQLREQARESVNDVLPMIEDQTLARILMMPGPRYVPKWLWRRIKAWQLNHYKQVYGLRSKPKPAEPKPEDVLATIAENLDYPCPKHGVDYLDDNNKCTAEGCDWDPEKDKPTCPQHGTDKIDKYGVCRTVTSVDFVNHQKVERHCNWYPEKDGPTAKPN